MAKGFNLTAEINLRGPSNIRTIVADIRRQLGTVTADVTVRIDPGVTRSINTLNQALQRLNTNLQNTRTYSNQAVNALNSLASVGNRVNSTISSLPRNVQATSTAVSNLTRNTTVAARSIQTARTEFEEFGRQGALAVRRFAAFAIVTGTIFKINNAISSAAKEFLSFNKELIRVSQVTGTSVKNLDFLVNKITGLSTSLGVTSQDLIQVSSTLAQAGLSARDTEKALKALALSALAPSFDSLSDTVEGSIALMRQFGISAGDLEKALGSVNAVAAKFAVESGDIITAIQRTGGVFAAASKGVSEGTNALNEFIAVFTSVRQTTRESAETIATGLRTIFTRIQRADTIDALKQYGVALTDLQGKFVGPYEAVRRLAEGLNLLDPRDLRFSRIVEELGGFRQIGKVIPLIQQFTVAQQALVVAQRGQGSLTEDAAIAQQSLANKISKVREEFVSLIRSIGQSEGFQNFISLSLDLASALIRIADSAKNVLPALTAIAAIRGTSFLAQFATGFVGGLRRQQPRGFAAGGYVPGKGNTDTVPAMLTPGEFVIRKKAVEKIGVNRLSRLNRNSGGSVPTQYFEDGGPVQRFAGGKFVMPKARGSRGARGARGPKGFQPLSSEEYAKWSKQIYSQWENDPSLPMDRYMGIPMPKPLADYQRKIRKYALESGGAGLALGRDAKGREVIAKFGKAKETEEKLGKLKKTPLGLIFSAAGLRRGPRAPAGQMEKVMAGYQGSSEFQKETSGAGSSLFASLKGPLSSFKKGGTFGGVITPGSENATKIKGALEKLLAQSSGQDAIKAKTALDKFDSFIAGGTPEKPGHVSHFTWAMNQIFKKGIATFGRGGSASRRMGVFDFDMTTGITKQKETPSLSGFKDPTLAVPDILGASPTGLVELMKRYGASQILTARSGGPRGEMRTALGTFFKKNGVLLPSSRITTLGDQIGSLGTAEKKARALHDLVKKYGRVDFFDDDQANIDAAKMVRGVDARRVAIRKNLGGFVQKFAQKTTTINSGLVEPLSPVDQKLLDDLRAKFGIDNVALTAKGISIKNSDFEGLSRATKVGGLGQEIVVPFKELGKKNFVPFKKRKGTTYSSAQEQLITSILSARNQYIQQKEISATESRAASLAEQQGLVERVKATGKKGVIVGLRGDTKEIEDRSLFTTTPDATIKLDNKIKKRLSGFETEIVRGALPTDIATIIAKDIEKTIRELVGRIGRQISKRAGVTGTKGDRSIGRVIKKQMSQFEGLAFESGLAIANLNAGGRYNPKWNAMDFAMGLEKDIAELFGVPANVAADAARQATQETARKKVQSGQITRGLGVGGEVARIRRTIVNRLARQQRVKSRGIGTEEPQRLALGGEIKGISSSRAREAILGKQLNGVEMIKAARRAGYDIEELDNGMIQLSRNNKIMHTLSRPEVSKLLGSVTTGYNLGGNIQKFALGGSAEDKVPALLTPGEFVINKRAARSIGAARLNKLNHADKIKGFNKGGSVGHIQKFAKGGTPEKLAEGVGSFDSVSKQAADALAKAMKTAIAQEFKAIRLNNPRISASDAIQQARANVQPTANFGLFRAAETGDQNAANMVADAQRKQVNSIVKQIRAADGNVSISQAKAAAERRVADAWGGLYKRTKEQEQQASLLSRAMSRVSGLYGRIKGSDLTPQQREAKASRNARIAQAGMAFAFTAPMLADQLGQGIGGPKGAGISEAATSFSTYAGVGAQLGPIGAFVGALVGAAAAIDGFKNGVLKAENEISKAKIERETEKAEKTVSRLESDPRNKALTDSLVSSLDKMSSAEADIQRRNAEMRQPTTLGRIGAGLQTAASYATFGLVSEGRAGPPKMGTPEYNNLIKSIGEENAAASKSRADQAIRALSSKGGPEGLTIEQALGSFGSNANKIQESIASGNVEYATELAKLTEFVKAGAMSTAELDQRKKELIQKYYLEETESLKAAMADKARAMAAQKVTKALNTAVTSIDRTFGNMEAALNRGSDALTNASTRLESVASGRASIEASFSGQNILENPRAYSRSERTVAIRQAASSFGPDMAFVERLSSVGNQIKDSITSIGARGQSTGATKEATSQNIQRAVDQQLQAAFGNNDLARQLSEQVRQALGNQLQDKESEDLDIDKLLSEATGLTSIIESEKKAFELLAQATKQASQAIDLYSSQVSKATEILNELDNINAEGVAMRASNDFRLREMFDQRIPVRERLVARRDEAAARAGVKPDQFNLNALLGRLQILRQTRSNVEAQRDDFQASRDFTDPKTVEGISRFNSSLISLNNQVDKTKNALKNLPRDIQGAIDDVAGAMQERLGKIESQRQAGAGFAEKLATSTPEELRDLNNTYNILNGALNGQVRTIQQSVAAQQAYQKTINDGGTAAEAMSAAQNAFANENRQAFSMFSELIDVAGIDKQQANTMRADLLENMARSQGMNMQNNPIFNKIVENLRRPPGDDPEIKRLQTLYKQLQDTQQKALEANRQIVLEDSANLIRSAGEEVKKAIETARISFNEQQLNDIGLGLSRPSQVMGKADGGMVYASTGKLINFKPRGTDTVPAMLTPGEFVVNARATQQNLPLLQAINKSSGGKIHYLNKGSSNPVGTVSRVSVPTVPNIQTDPVGFINYYSDQFKGTPYYDESRKLLEQQVRAYDRMNASSARGDQRKAASAAWKDFLQRARGGDGSVPSAPKPTVSSTTPPAAATKPAAVTADVAATPKPTTAAAPQTAAALKPRTPKAPRPKPGLVANPSTNDPVLGDLKLGRTDDLDEVKRIKADVLQKWNTIAASATNTSSRDSLVIQMRQDLAQRLKNAGIINDANSVSLFPPGGRNFASLAPMSDEAIGDILGITSQDRIDMIREDVLEKWNQIARNGSNANRNDLLRSMRQDFTDRLVSSGIIQSPSQAKFRRSIYDATESFTDIYQGFTDSGRAAARGGRRSRVLPTGASFGERLGAFAGDTAESARGFGSRIGAGIGSARRIISSGMSAVSNYAGNVAKFANIPFAGRGEAAGPIRALGRGVTRLGLGGAYVASTSIGGAARAGAAGIRTLGTSLLPVMGLNAISELYGAGSLSSESATLASFGIDAVRGGARALLTSPFSTNAFGGAGGRIPAPGLAKQASRLATANRFLPRVGPGFNPTLPGTSGIDRAVARGVGAARNTRVGAGVARAVSTVGGIGGGGVGRAITGARLAAAPAIAVNTALSAITEGVSFLYDKEGYSNRLAAEEESEYASARDQSATRYAAGQALSGFTNPFRMFAKFGRATYSTSQAAADNQAKQQAYDQRSMQQTQDWSMGGRMQIIEGNDEGYFSDPTKLDSWVSARKRVYLDTVTGQTYDMAKKTDEANFNRIVSGDRLAGFGLTGVERAWVQAKAELEDKKAQGLIEDAEYTKQNADLEARRTAKTDRYTRGMLWNSVTQENLMKSENLDAAVVSEQSRLTQQRQEAAKINEQKRIAQEAETFIQTTSQAAQTVGNVATAGFRFASGLFGQGADFLESKRKQAAEKSRMEEVQRLADLSEAASAAIKSPILPEYVDDFKKYSDTRISLFNKLQELRSIQLGGTIGSPEREAAAEDLRKEKEDIQRQIAELNSTIVKKQREGSKVPYEDRQKQWKKYNTGIEKDRVKEEKREINLALKKEAALYENLEKVTRMRVPRDPERLPEWRAKALEKIKQKFNLSGDPSTDIDMMTAYGLSPDLAKNLFRPMNEQQNQAVYDLLSQQTQGGVYKYSDQDLQLLKLSRQEIIKRVTEGRVARPQDLIKRKEQLETAREKEFGKSIKAMSKIDALAQRGMGGDPRTQARFRKNIYKKLVKSGYIDPRENAATNAQRLSSLNLGPNTVSFIYPNQAGGMLAQMKSSGGMIYASAGKLINFQPRGTDTVPAMLTPGEFVVNARATQQHLPMLQAINKAKGGRVSYYNEGGSIPMVTATGPQESSNIRAQQQALTIQKQTADKLNSINTNTNNTVKTTQNIDNNKLPSLSTQAQNFQETTVKNLSGLSDLSNQNLTRTSNVGNYLDKNNFPGRFDTVDLDLAYLVDRVGHMHSTQLPNIQAQTDTIPKVAREIIAASVDPDIIAGGVALAGPAAAGRFAQDQIDAINRFSRGGIVYASNGMLIPYKPRGTDTVPAMLTPGEFVVNARATQQHLPLLKSINAGTQQFADGGVVYAEDGMAISRRRPPLPSQMDRSKRLPYKEPVGPLPQSPRDIYLEQERAGAATRGGLDRKERPLSRVEALEQISQLDSKELYSKLSPQEELKKKELEAIIRSKSTKSKGYFRGGPIYASAGTLVNFRPRGTDTVPAMLTPGEFVVNRSATQANLPLLQAINGGAKGFSSGGQVNYMADGGLLGQMFKPMITSFVSLTASITNTIQALQTYQKQLAGTQPNSVSNTSRPNTSLDGLSEFTSKFDQFIVALNRINIPPMVQLQVAPVTVNITGAEALVQALEGPMGQMLHQEITASFARLSASTEGAIPG